MMKSGLIILLMLTFMPAWSQQYAGEEKIGCSGPGVAIGVDNPNPDHCYLWGVEDGLTPEQVNEKNPIVHPKETTWYTVTVTDQQFSFKAVDRVKVSIFFGGIKFSPTYIYPDGEQNQSKATLTTNGLGTEFPPSSYTWSIHADPDGTGAVISSDGWISNCTQSGKVTVRATKDDNPSCYAEEIIEVNIGVKDVIATDMVNEGRLAKDKDTLYIVKQPSTSHLVQFKAIPNDEATFPTGQPNWEGNPMPPSGNQASWFASLENGTYTVYAGDKKVTVVVSTPFASTIQKSLDFSLLKDFKDNKIPAYGLPLQSPYCTPIPIGVTLPAENITFGLAVEEVNKFKDPNTANKYDFSISLPAIGLAGCVPIINLSFIVGIPGVGDVWVFPYLRGAAGITLSGNVIKDPSSEMSQWDGSINAVGKVELYAGVGVDASLGPVGLSASGEAGGEYQLKCRFNEGKIEWNSSASGLQVKFAGYVYLGSPSNPSFTTPTFELGPYKIIDGFETPYSLLVDLNVD